MSLFRFRDVLAMLAIAIAFTAVVVLCLRGVGDSAARWNIPREVRK